MRESQLLLIPGPTPVPPSVLRAHSRPMINHRGPEFASLQQELVDGLKGVFCTSGDVLILTCSGTGAMETAVVNVLSPGDLVLGMVIGAFGDRFAKIAEVYGARVERMEVEWGKAADPSRVAERLRRDKNKEIKAVVCTHNESSTGVTNPLKEIAQAVREHGALLLVDAVSSLGAIELRTDDWGVDIVASASQKALMNPPGLGLVSVSQRAWEASKKAKMPRFYFDIQQAKSFQEKGQTPWTPALPQMYGLQEALSQFKEVGLEAMWKRHARVAEAARKGVAAMGLKLFADPAYASNTVTAIHNPDGKDSAPLRKLLREKYGLVLAGGQAKLSDKIFRIGHMGFVGETEVLSALACLGMGLKELGFEADTQAALAAAHETLR